MRTFAALSSLLLSTALLLIGHGLQLTLLPLRAVSLGMSDAIIGFTAALYFLGFAIGCLGMPVVISRAGHIRAFAVASAMLICCLIALEFFSNWLAWSLLRFITGFAISGLYAIIESWLTSQSTASTRGQILATYTFITLIAMLLGQFLINVGPASSSLPFDVAVLFIAMAIIPIGLTRQPNPAPVEATQVGFLKLYSRSHSAFAGALLSGLCVGSFWSLGATYAQKAGYSVSGITLFMSTAMLGGMVAQYPVGWLSDKIERRWVLVMLSIGVAASAAVVSLLLQHRLQLISIFLFGAMALPIYAISLATAADVSTDDNFVEIGTSILLLHAIGAVVTSIAVGHLMTVAGPNALFWSMSLGCCICAVYLLVQLRTPRAVPTSEQVPFSPAATDTAPGAFELDPRASDESESTDHANAASTSADAY